jgi:GTP-binding protein HflX
LGTTGKDTQAIEARKAVIVAVELSGEEDQHPKEDLDELQALLMTLGYEVSARVIQKRQRLTASLLLGAGKVEEIRDAAKETGATMVVFDRTLSPPQVRNLEKITGCEVLDRTGVILEIFARHARSNEAKIQVDIARLEYELPRMGHMWTHLERQSGGGNLQRGMGEKQIEVDRRRARDRIAKLKKELETVRQGRQTRRKARGAELKVSIVGYTNSGKTTVMRGLTKAKIQGENKLFATLDTTVRTIDPTTRPKILLSDTVGFIRNLPHGLVESFKSTLEEVAESDLLLHVVDASHDAYREQMAITDEVLISIGAGDIPTLMVFNKIDACDDPFLPKVLRGAYDMAVAISAQREEDIEQLRRKIYDYFEMNLMRATLLVAHEDAQGLSLVHRYAMILKADYERPGAVVFDVQATKAAMAKLQPYILEEEKKPRVAPKGKRR